MAVDPTFVKSCYEQAQRDRIPYEEDWRNCARLALPQQYGGWTSPDSPAVQGVKQARVQVLDATAMKSVPRFVALLNRISTPDGYDWHGLKASNRELNKIRAVNIYFEDLTDALFQHRRNPKSHWSVSRFPKYASIGVYGPGVEFISERKATAQDRGGPFYRNVPLRDVFIDLDFDGRLYHIYRRMRPNAQQARRLFPEPIELPKAIENELQRKLPDTQKRFEIVHYVAPNDDYEESSLDHRQFVWSSAYVYVDAGGPSLIGEQSGFYVMPYTVPTYFPEPENPYGYSPCQVALSSIGGVNAMKRTMLKQAQRAADPTMLAADDGILGGQVSLVPGTVNYGAITKDGKQLLQPLAPGNFEIAKEIIADERIDIEDSFLVSVFRILQEHPEMSAAEVWDRQGKESALVAPVAGMMLTQDIGPTIEREIDILTRNGLAPEMPPELVEARGEYDVIPTAPLWKALKSESVSSMFRLMQSTAEIANLTQDASLMQRFDMNEFIPDAADIMAIPSRWLRSDDEVAALKEQAQQQQMVQQAADAAPAIAGAMKAASAASTGNPRKTSRY